MSKTYSSVLTIVALIAVLVFCIATISSIGEDSQANQFDFPVFYYSAKAYFEGGVNPHDRGLVEEYIKWERTLNGNDFNYGPITLLLFLPLSRLNDYLLAAKIYLAFKLILLVSLIYFWRTEYFPKTNWALFVAFCIFAFNGAIFLDLKSGNVSILEQVALWTGFYFYTRKRWWLFSACVIAASLFKFTPILFLGMLLVTDDKRRYRYFFGAGLAFATLIGPLSMALVGYTNYLTFVRKVVGTLGRGDDRLLNPATPTLVEDVLQSLFGSFGLTTVPLVVRLGVYAVVAGIVLWLAWRVYKKIEFFELPEKRLKVVVMFSCLTFALIAPRLKDYSYILLIVPVLFFITRQSLSQNSALWIALILLSTFNPWTHANTFSTLTMPIIRNFDYLWGYYSLLMIYIIWGLYVWRLYRMSAEVISAGDAL